MMETVKNNWLDTLANKRNVSFSKITENENKIFEKYVSTHQLTPDNMPGIFFTDFPHSYLMVTPSQVWQSWLFYRHIYQQCHLQNNDSPILNLSVVYDEMIVLINNDYLRMTEGMNRPLLKHLIIEWANLLKDIGMIVKAGGPLYEIHIDTFELMNKLEANLRVEAFVSSILPNQKGTMDLTDEIIPKEMQESVYKFITDMRNSRTGNYMNQFQPVSARLRAEMPNDVIIITNEHEKLETSLKSLTEGQKDCISKNLKENPALTAEQLCLKLVENKILNKFPNEAAYYEYLECVKEYIFSGIWLFK